jgi:hypothetical protein
VAFGTILAGTVGLLVAAPESSPSCLTPVVIAPTGTTLFDSRFAPGTESLAALSENVAAGFRRACEQGLLDSGSILSVPRRSAARLIIENAPEANIASFSADQRPDGDWRLILEYPFVRTDGAVGVPSTDEIAEAIFCAVRGASEQEQEESGRCLPD